MRRNYFSTALDDDIAEKIKAMARAEQRTDSEMIRIVVSKAVSAK